MITVLKKCTSFNFFWQLLHMRGIKRYIFISKGVHLGYWLNVDVVRLLKKPKKFQLRKVLERDLVTWSYTGSYNLLGLCKWHLKELRLHLQVQSSIVRCQGWVPSLTTQRGAILMAMNETLYSLSTELYGLKLAIRRPVTCSGLPQCSNHLGP